MAAEPVPVPAQPRGRLPRWACQTSLFQLREPAFWVYVLLLAGTGLQAVGQQESLRAMSPSGWALSWLLLLVYLVPVFVVVYLLDAYEREPLSLVFGTLLWGAVAATWLVGLANHDGGGVVARLLGPDVAARSLDGRPDRPVGRGDPQSPRGGAHLPDRPVGDQRRRGRLCLRGNGGAGVRRGRERLLLRRAVRRPAGRCHRRLLRPRPGQRAVPAGRGGSLPVELAAAQPAPNRRAHPGRAAGCHPAGRRRQGRAPPGRGGPARRPGPPTGAPLAAGGCRGGAGRAGAAARGAGGPGTARPALAGQAGAAPPLRPAGRLPAHASAPPAAQPGHATDPAHRRRRPRPGQPAPTDRPDPRSPARGDRWISGRGLSQPMLSIVRAASHPDPNPVKHGP